MKFDTKKLLMSLPLVILCCGWLQAFHAHADDAKASKSVELKVDPGFGFGTHQQIHLDISATNTLGDPLRGALVRVYALDASKDTYQDEVPNKTQVTMVSMGKTDDSGWLVRTIEIPQHYQTLWVTLGAIGDKNYRMVDIDESLTIAINF